MANGQDGDGRPLAANTELELKFAIAPDQMKELRAPVWLRARQQGRTATRQLNAIYFDTPERRIWKEGLNLRVRKEGRRFVQTVKTRGVLRDAAFTRGEWKAPVRGAAPDLAPVLEESDLAARLPAQAREHLAPVFETEIRRTKRLLRTPEGSDVEWALDVGEIKTADGSTPVCELELELLDGPTDGLFALARDVIAHVPVRLITRSKADRGYALAFGDAAPWHKARPVDLDRQATAEDALAQTLVQCLDHMASNEDCVLARAHVEGVHQMRVALRRLRSALNIYRRYIPAADFERLHGQAKHAIGQLGHARDWDVFVTEILPPVAGWIEDDDALSALGAEAERHRDRAYDQAQAMVRSPAYSAMQLDFGAWIHGRAWRNQDASPASARLFAPAADLGRAALEKRHRKLLKAGRHLKTMTVADRHRLRIAVKKQRYAAEFFAGLFPAKTATKYVARLSALQDHLGLLNDIATAEHLGREIVAGATPDRAALLSHGTGLVVGWRQRELRRHEAALLRDWKDWKAAKTFW